MQFDPHHLAALAAVLRLGSFDQAAAHLSVTPSAVSQRIKALEEKVGATLVNRGAPCTGTDAGSRLAKHAEDVGLLEAQVSRDLSLEAASGPARIRIAVNADSLATWFVPALAACDELLFDLVIDDQDHSADWLRRGEVSAAVTALDRTVPGCDRFELGAMRYLATAAPDFVDHWFPDGIDSASLETAPCVMFNAKDGLQRDWLRQVTGLRLAPPTHFIPSSRAFLEACRLGLGWGMNPESLARGPIRNGRLTVLAPDVPLDIALNWQVTRIMAPALKPVTRAVLGAAEKGLLPLVEDVENS